mgnify:CR=1 FL=1
MVSPNLTISGFQHQAVRDLAWCLSSPPLFDALPDVETLILPEPWYRDSTVNGQLHDWLRQLDREPSPLLAHLRQARSPRLGIYFEGLFGFFWRHFPQHRVLHQNLQVKQEKTTLGEFDFIARQRQKWLHIETAVKFYLGVEPRERGQSSPTESEWHQWVGPNCNDRLDKKLHRLLQHQLKLSHHPAAQVQLARLGIRVEQLQTALQLQGYLFYPAHTPLPPPHHSSAAHLRGLWYYWRDFRELLTRLSPCDWILLPKSNWLSPARITTGSDDNQTPRILSAEQICKQLADYFDSSVTPTRQRPLLLAKIAAEDDIWWERERCFVVPDHWPWNTTPSLNT